MSKAPLASSLNHSLQVLMKPCACGLVFGTPEKSRMSSAKDLTLPSHPLALQIGTSVAAASIPAHRGLPARAGEQKLPALFTLTFCLVLSLFRSIPM